MSTSPTSTRATVTATPAARVNRPRRVWVDDDADTGQAQGQLRCVGQLGQDTGTTAGTDVRAHVAPGPTAPARPARLGAAVSRVCSGSRPRPGELAVRA